MEGKKKYIAIILFLLIGLGVFTFAAPDEEEGNVKGTGTNVKENVDGEQDEQDKSNNTFLEDEENKGNETDSSSEGVRNNSSTTNNNNAYQKALAAVVKLEQVLTDEQAQTARKLCGEVTNSKQYADLISRIENAEKAIDATSLVSELEKMVLEAMSRSDIESSTTYRDETVTPAISSIKGKNLESIKEELVARINTLSKILNDTTQPSIEGIEDGAKTNKDVVLVITDENEVTITVTKNGNEYAFAETFTEEGIYEVKVVDAAFLETTITFTIDKTPVVIKGLKDTSFVYDGKGVIPATEDTDVKSVELTKDGATLDGYTLGTAIINAGEYKLVVLDEAGNKTTIEFTIEKATPTITMTPEEGSKFRYDMTAKLATATLNKVEGNEGLEVTYKDDKGYKHTEPTKPGKYTATAVFEGDENYKAVSASVKYQIIKAQSSIELSSEPSTLIYDGKAKEFGATVKLVNGTKSATITYYDAKGNKLESAPVNAGSYKVVASFKGDTLHDGAKSIEKEFTIEKATPTITMTPEEGSKFRYDMTAKLATATLNKVEGSEGLEVTYKDDKGYKHTEPTKPGKYTATAVFEGDENYKAVSASVKYQIIKAQSSIEFTSEPSTLIYDGKTKEFGATVKLVNGTKSATITYYDAKGNKLESAPVNAGSYKVVASFKGDTLHDGAKSIEKEFTIEKAETEIVFEFPNLVYDGSAKNVVAKVMVKGTNTLIKEVTPVYKNTSYENLNTTPVNAGTYIVAAYFADTNNYVKSYNQAEYTIEKAETEIVFTLPENLVYSETAKEVTAKVMVKGTDTLIKEVTPVYKNSSWQNLQSAPVNAGTYIVAAYYYETENYKTSYNSLEFTIEKATPTIKLTEPSLVYNGEKQEYGIKVYDVIGNEVAEPNMVVVYKDADGNSLSEAPTNAGTYTLGIYVRPNENYTRADKWITFTVEQKQLNFEFTMDKVLKYDDTPKTANINVLNTEDESDYLVKTSYYVMNSNNQYQEPLNVSSVTD